MCSAPAHRFSKIQELKIGQEALNQEGVWTKKGAMHTPISFIHLITKSGHSQAESLGGVIQTWLHRHGCRASIVPSEKYVHMEPGCASLPDMILVLGGDGTLLRVAGRVAELGIPVVGINFGQVGFLTALSPEKWEPALSHILAGNYCIRPRLVLGYELWRDKEAVNSGHFLNDLVVGRSGLARLVRLSLWSGEHLMTALRADGVIVSTPVGSTAYAAAAGGGLISPELEVMEICPVCSFMSEFRPLILPSDQEVSVRVESSSPQCFVTLDGQSGWPLLEKDLLRIQARRYKFLLVETEEDTFFQHLQRVGYL
jgi:NAD+ kinase